MSLVTISWANVEAIAPELTAPGVSLATQAAILADVALEVVNEDWGARANSAAAYLAAHKATLTKRRGAGAGPITAMSVGPASVSFAKLDTGGTSLASTVYGQEYERMLRQNASFRILPLSDDTTLGLYPYPQGWW